MNGAALRLGPAPAGGYDAILVDNGNMEPDVPRGSVAFLEPPGVTGVGIYSVPCQGEHRGDLRRLCVVSDGYRLRIDNWPEHSQPRPISRDELFSIGLRRVAGIAKPFTAGFQEFLRSRLPD